MLHEIKKVEHIGRYKLKLYFRNGKIKIFDMEDRLRTAKNMFLPLKDIDFFSKVKCEDGTIVWPNGVDLCPEMLFKCSKDVPREKRKRSGSLSTKKTKKSLKKKLL